MIYITLWSNQTQATYGHVVAASSCPNIPITTGGHVLGFPKSPGRSRQNFNILLYRNPLETPIQIQIYPKLRSVSEKILKTYNFELLNALGFL